MIKLPERYSEILDTFSEGGMSDTYLCNDAHLQRKVVVKTLKPGVAPLRLRDELAALSAIRSRYVVQIYDVIIEGGIPVAMVEEYLAGVPLTSCLPGCTAADALKVLYPISAGISDIHDHSRVHRDLKPDNMRYDAEGQLKIYDFGLAKEVSSGGTGTLYYTPGFTAPEAFKRGANGLHQYDYPVDVYAFGCVALWLLNGGSIPDCMEDVPPRMPIPPIDFTKLPAQVPTAVAQVLDRCLAINPIDRPSMQECKKVISAELLRNRHKMLLTFKDQEFLVDQSTPKRSVTSNGHSVSISYNGVNFIVSAVVGIVMINNAAAQVGQIMTGSTVIVLGVDDRANRKRRASITCDVSHPEVTL